MAGFALLAALVGLLVAAPARAVTLPDGFHARPLASGLTGPTAVDWAPDGRMFVAELGGRVRVVSGGTLVDEPLVDISDHVNAYWDRGLLGLAVDTDFEDNGYLYLLYTHEDAGEPGDDGPKTARLTRVTVRPDNTVVDPADPETVLLGTVGTPPCPPPSNAVDCIPADSPFHTIGTVRSAPDGTLWVGAGDGAGAGWADPLALRVSDPESLAGKILHVDRQGRGLPGHPFCPGDADLSHTCTKVFAKGFRNPFRFTLRPSPAGPAVGDVGSATQEEVDLTAPGRDYGWPCYEGTVRTPEWQDTEACRSRYEGEPAQGAPAAPDFAYGVDWEGGAVVGGPLYPGGDYGASFAGDRFYGDYSMSTIRRLRWDANGNPVSEPFAADVAPVDLELTPSGNLAYVVPFGFNGPSGAVIEVLRCPDNCPPTAQARAEPSSGALPLRVRLDATGSSDPDGDDLSYGWDFGDGDPGSSEPDPVHEYTVAGVHRARVTVADGHGGTGTATVLVSAGNTAPVPVIDAPPASLRYGGGERVEVRGHATDAEDAEVPPERLRWNVSFRHSFHMHPLHSTAGDATSFVTGMGQTADRFHYEITLTATDSNGLSRARTLVIHPDDARPGGPLDHIHDDDPGPLDGGPIGDVSRGTPDRAGPAIRFDARRASRDASLGRLRGSAFDPSGVAGVWVALRRASSVGGNCRWWSPSTGRLAHRRRPCATPAWVRARVASAGGWVADLGGRPRPGRYLVSFRGVDGAGNVARTANGRAPLALTVPRG